MAADDRPLRDLDENVALRAIVQGTASETGVEFYRALAGHLAEALGTYGAWVTEYDAKTRRLRALGFRFGGRWIDDYQYAIAGTPCEPVVDERRMIHIPDRILDLYPGQPEDFQRPGVVSYLGVPLLDVDDTVLGHLAVVDTRPLPEDERILGLVRIFSQRATAELRRVRAEERLRNSQAELTGLIDSAMDAILEFDGGLQVVLMNHAARRLLGCHDPGGRGLATLLGDATAASVAELATELASPRATKTSLWLPDGVRVARLDGTDFPAEGTLSRFVHGGASRFTLILRNVQERLDAEQQIESLTARARYLEAEIETEHDFGEILGESRSLRRALRDLEQVAPLDTTVLIHGETGTGKELFARALHRLSARSDGPLVKVNCAAIPTALMESEFFGHEKGAFTGATERREGRFALADGGTIFLDEIGELPLDLQAKLLRVLQEGEFERVGGTKQQRVDVRVVAATNRDLAAEVKAGRFREDLYYRVHVFPVEVPPLRERGDDVELIASALVDSLGRRMGRSFDPLDQEDLARLRAYPWPGNVRELRNVIERALITATGRRVDLSRALGGGAQAPPAELPATEDRVLTADELRALERENTLRALRRASWQVAGEGGAAEQLGVHPSTLKSRMRALDIRRPR